MVRRQAAAGRLPRPRTAIQNDLLPEGEAPADFVTRVAPDRPPVFRPERLHHDSLRISLNFSLNFRRPRRVFSRMWKRTGLVLALLSAAAFAKLPASGSETRPFAPGGAILLSVPVGKITVHPTTGSRIQLQYTVHPDKNGPAASVEDMSLEFQVQDHHAAIRFVDQQEHHQKEPSIDVVLEIPAQTDLDLQIGVGKMTLISGWQGRVHMKAGVGDIVVHGATRSRLQSLDASAGVGHIHSTDWGDGHGFVSRVLHANGVGSGHLSAEVGVGSLRFEP